MHDYDNPIKFRVHHPRHDRQDPGHVYIEDGQAVIRWPCGDGMELGIESLPETIRLLNEYGDRERIWVNPSDQGRSGGEFFAQVFEGKLYVIDYAGQDRNSNPCADWTDLSDALRTLIREHEAKEEVPQEQSQEQV